MKSEAQFADAYIPEPMSGCWIWLLHLHRLGYGRVRWRGKMRQAHVVSYEINVGPVPDGLELDHNCKLRCCVNPDHLEPVTHLENVRRGTSPSAVHGAKTHCKHGHPFTAKNTYLWASRMRQCRTCGRQKTKDYMARKRAKQ